MHLTSCLIPSSDSILPDFYSSYFSSVINARKLFSEVGILSDNTCASPVKYALKCSAICSGSFTKQPSIFISFIIVSLLPVLTIFLIICQGVYTETGLG